MKKLLPTSISSGFKKGLKGILTVCAFGAAVQGAQAQYLESFNSTSVPAGWTNTSSTGSTSAAALWKFSGNPDYAMNPTSDHSGNGGSFAWVDGSSPSNLTSSLETVGIPVTGLTNPHLRFWLKSNIGTYSTTPNPVTVDIYDGTTWHNAVLTHSGNTTNGQWEEFVVSLTSYTFAGNAKFRFNVSQTGSTAFYNDIALDDVELFDMPNCVTPPTAGTVAMNITGVCTSDIFTLSLSGASSGYGMTYQWQESADNITWTNIANSNSSTLSTSQSSEKYYRCILTCSGMSATTPEVLQPQNSHTACYCDSYATSPSYTMFSDIKVGNLEDLDRTSCQTFSSYLADTIHIVQGQNLELMFGAGNCTNSLSYANHLKVYLDSNMDGIYSETSEVIYSGAITSFQSAQFSHLIPTNATLGETGVRAVIERTTGAANVSACGTYTYGETSDFVVKIHATPANDVGIAGFANNSGLICSVEDSLKVEMQNLGASTLTSAVVNYSVNGTIQTPINWTGSIAPLLSSTENLGYFNFSAGDTVLVWTTQPNASLDGFAANDTFEVVIPEASLNGVYVVDPDVASSADYNSLSDVMADLDTYGICGDVEIKLVDTVFLEQLKFENIEGTDNHTITFSSLSGNAENVVITYPTISSANYVVSFDNVSNITFENITIYNIGSTYSNVVLFEGNTDNITIESCHLIGPVQSGSNSNRSVVRGTSGGNNNITINNSLIKNNGYGIYMQGSSTNKDSNVVITNNRIEDVYNYSAYLYYKHNMVFDNNKITNTSSNAYVSAYAIYGYYVTGTSSISNNYVKGTDVWIDRGLYLYGCDGTINSPLQVYNNRLSLGKGNGSSNTIYGIYQLSSDFIEYANNSILIDSSASSTSNGLYLSSGIYTAYNNIVVNNANGEALEVTTSAVCLGSDNNSFYSTGANVVRYSNVNYPSVSSYSAATSLDQNSLQVMNAYSDDETLAVCNDSLYAAGTSISYITIDSDGDNRNAIPCIGADEFLPMTMAALPNELIICNNDTLEFRLDYFDQAIWDNGVVLDTTITQEFTGTGAFFVTAENTCGTLSDSVYVNFQNSPNISDVSVLCGEDSTILNASYPGVNSIVWNNGSVDSTLLVTMPGTYFVSTADIHGCTASDTVVVSHVSNVDLPDTTTVVCQGSSVYLDAQMPGSYLWSDGSTNQVLQITNSGIYSVEVVSNEGCVSTDSAEVEVINIPVADVSINESYLSIFTFNNPEAGVDYSWDFGDGNVYNEEEPIHLYDSNGTYLIVLTASNQCGMDTAQFNVNINVSSVAELGQIMDLDLYPNPTKDVVNVSLNSDKAGSAQLKLYSLEGKLVKAENIQLTAGNNTIPFQLSTVTSGLYNLQIVVDNKVTNTRIVKQ